MKLSHLPHFADLAARDDVKVLRHRDAERDLWDVRSNGRLDHYQNGQSWDVFGGARYLISFIAERNKYAKFVGVWEVLGKSKRPNGSFRYRTRELNGYSDLVGRLVVEWGDGTRSWAQWLDRAGDKAVFQLLPPNYVMDFPGFYSFTLSYQKLKEMMENPDSNREWHRMLASVSGFYVILHGSSGKQYIGSAYGKGGIWARWRSYAKNPSGGNTHLKQLLAKRPTAYRDFQFSILRVLESGATRDEVLAQEVLTKEKLGSRVFGLNNN